MQPGPSSTPRFAPPCTSNFNTLRQTGTQIRCLGVVALRQNTGVGAFAEASADATFARDARRTARKARKEHSCGLVSNSEADLTFFLHDFWAAVNLKVV